MGGRAVRKPSRVGQAFAAAVAVLMVGPAVGSVVAAANEAAPVEQFVVGFMVEPPVADGDRFAGADVVRVDPFLRFAVVTAPDDGVFLSRAAAHPLVAYVEVDHVATTMLAPNDPRYSSQYGPQQVRAHQVWDDTLGSTDINVCIADTGVRYTHEDIQGPRWLGGYDYINNDNDPWDDHGHGTHVAGIAAAGVNNGVGIAGVGNVGILAVKVLNSGGSGSYSAIASGVRWCADNAGHIISMSLGGSSGSSTLRNALDYAWDAGSLIISAAGNSGPCSNCIAYPAKYDESMAVTCTTSSESQCSFSSDGPESEIAAPGASVLSSYYSSDTSYRSLSGTSMSTPYVSGVAALVWSQAPSFTHQNVRDLLTEHARDVGASGWDQQYGHGIVNAKTMYDALVFPSEPLNVAAVAGPWARAITLTWEPPLDDGGAPLTGYRIYREIGGSFIEIASLGVVQEYVDPGLEEGATHSYRVAAVSKSVGPQSPTVTATTWLGPVPSFIANPSTVEPGDPVTFTDTSTDSDGAIVSWSWDFGDGATSSDQNPVHTFTETGTYSVALTVADDDGASSTTSQNVIVTLPPEPDFSWAPFAPFALDDVNFFDGSSDPDGDVVAWSWDFGDGATATGRVPQHAFADDGLYDVTLTVTDDAGLSASLTKQVEVFNNAPAVDFSVSPPNPTTQTPVSFADLSSDRDGDITARSWDFGDGATATGASATHTFADDGTFTVTLTVEDDDGSVSTIERDVVVANVGPVAAFGYAPVPPTDLDDVRFTDHSGDPDGFIASWDWQWGDGTSTTCDADACTHVAADGSTIGTTPGPQATHRFPDDGTFVVALTVTDDDGATASTEQTLTVLNVAPSAAFTLDPATVTDLDDVTFMDGSVDDDGSIVSRDWDFGDGTTATCDETACAYRGPAGEDLGTTASLDPVHRFPDDGAFRVTLTVMDDDGADATAEEWVTVDNVPAVAAFDASTTEPVAGVDAVAFTDTSTDPDGEVVAWSWDFGDGATSNDRNPTHTFPARGVFAVTLTVQDDDGDLSSTSMEIEVLDVPSAPRNVQATIGIGVGLGFVDVTWEAPDDDGGQPLTAFVVYRAASAGGPFEAVATVDASATSWQDTERDLLVEYHYAVAAANRVGEGDRSASDTGLGTSPFYLIE